MNTMQRPLTWGGVIASFILVAFGVASIFMGVTGRAEVRDNISREHIVGTPDMKSIANEKVTTGEEAKAFAAGIRKHTLEATGNRTYSEMGRFLTADGEETSDETKAAIDPKTKQPVVNGAREMWVTSTALQTALNTSYFAEQVSVFAMVMGIALLLTGIGFGLLVLGALRLPRETITVMPVRDRTPAEATV